MSTKRYPLRITRTAHGIRAQDLRTLVRTSWWARRWMAALESMRLGPRLGRGRQYAVQGQVTDLVMEGSHVEAHVTGSRDDPYRVTLDFTAVMETSTLGERLAAEPMLLARLLTDDLPTELESWFQAEGVPLFPKTEPLGKTPEGKPLFDVRMRCNCPDWARPCKHLVAVLLLLGEEITRRPASLLALRGVDLEDLVGEESVTENMEIVLPAQESQILCGNDPTALVKRLGPLPFWRGEARYVDSFAKIYTRAHAAVDPATKGQSIDLRV